MHESKKEKEERKTIYPEMIPNSYPVLHSKYFYKKSF